MPDPLPATEDAALAALLDTLLPGDGARWPAFTRAVPPASLRTALDAAMMQRLHGLSRGERAAADRIAAFERDEPAAFEALLRALYAAYYGAPAVQRAVRDLAAASPHEPSPHIDPGLVAGVLDREARRRREDNAPR